MILCGSRALNCYRINGKKLLNRKPNDWDFLVTKDQFIEICRDYNIYDFDLTKSQYHLNKSLASFSTGYGGESHWFPCFIQLIIQDELPNSKESGGVRFASLENIIGAKMDLANPIAVNQRADSKHQRDINNIIVNTYSL